ncbi:MAG: RloB family protein [Bacilli bacterium]|nr:RloB family protein [Bacillales bacterium]MDY2575413.1 RloB family protein [Bacilli bacterium]
MGTDNFNKRRSNERRERRSKELLLRAESWLIVCEGEITEPKYLNELFDYINSKFDIKISAKIEGTGMNTTSLVKSVDEFFAYSDQQVKNRKIPYGKVFTVFDKDDFSANDFNTAIKMSQQKGYIPLWSNECIEVWFILHYEYLQSSLPRKDYFKKLSIYMGSSYDKNGDNFNKLGKLTKLEKAIRYSKKLEGNYFNESTPSSKNPCTTMYKLFYEIADYYGMTIEEFIKKVNED